MRRDTWYRAAFLATGICISALCLEVSAETEQQGINQQGIDQQGINQQEINQKGINQQDIGQAETTSSDEASESDEKTDENESDRVICENEIGKVDDCDYELWKDKGDTTMTLQAEGKFTCEWSDINSALFRIGKKFGAKKNWQDYGNISVNYGADFKPEGNAYLCVYGWTKEPLVEYYVVESWGTWRPPGSASKGTITVDGVEYDVYETTRENQPSIAGTQTFEQYWSVRKQKNEEGEGTVRLAEHFREWEDMGMQHSQVNGHTF